MKTMISYGVYGMLKGIYDSHGICSACPGRWPGPAGWAEYLVLVVAVGQTGPAGQRKKSYHGTPPSGPAKKS